MKISLSAFIVFMTTLLASTAAEAVGLMQAVARSKQTGLPMFVVGSSDS